MTSVEETMNCKKATPILLAMFLSLLLAGAVMMSFLSCVEGTPKGMGTIRLQIEDIPENIMQAGRDSLIMIGISDPYTLQEERNSAIAGRTTEITSYDDIFTPSSYTFYVYTLRDLRRYIGKEGNYDIGIAFGDAATGVIRDRRLEINTLNVIKWSEFSGW